MKEIHLLVLKHWLEWQGYVKILSEDGLLGVPFMLFHSNLLAQVGMAHPCTNAHGCILALSLPQFF